MQLHEHSVEELEVALAKAREREQEERDARFPKCACGAKATQVAYPVVSYFIRELRMCKHAGMARVGERTDEQDVAPGEGGPCSDTMWVCCDKDECEQREWKLIGAKEVYVW